MSAVPQIASDAVLLKSEALPADTPKVVGYDFNEEFDFDKFVRSYLTTGFQATNLSLAVDAINAMLHWRLSDEDLIKCMAPMYLGAFDLDGKTLRSKGLNRTGNLLVPNDNYVLFEEWIYPVLDQMLEEQLSQGTVWSPSTMIHRFGKEINNPESVYYWAYKNDIPVFCPAITDGSIGDMVYFHSYKREEQLVIDIASDIKRINNIAVYAKGKTGILILGGGVVKHHICNANLMRNGADYSVYINTGQEFDGSDSGARPDEAISWGKIRANATAVKLYAEATLVFPLIVASTFAKFVKEQESESRAE